MMSGLVNSFSGILRRGLSLVACLMFIQPAVAAIAAAGIDPAIADPHWHIPVETGAGQSTPQHLAYRRLADAFERYRTILENGGWDAIGNGASLSIGQRDQRVAAIRRRLQATGDFTADVEADSYFFDTGLDAAVRRFQRRHRLHTTGVVDEPTRQAMNVTAEDRLVQIAVALERWNWLPRQLGQDHVWVNVPESRLEFVADGEPVLSMPVIVGHPDRPTPSFASNLRQIVFHPAWHVPHTISVEDLLPRQQRDPTFLGRNGIRVYRAGLKASAEIPAGQIDWSALDSGRFPYRLVQDPGPNNSLGRVKLVMDNPFDIYLHDSPAWRLFYLSARTLSSGCVRLADAPAFVHALMRRDQGWTNTDVADRLRQGPTAFVDLRHPVPVYIVYFTTWVDADETLYFARDVYRRDAPLAQALVRTQLAELLEKIKRGAAGDQLALGDEAPRL